MPKIWHTRVCYQQTFDGGTISWNGVYAKLTQLSTGHKQQPRGFLKSQSWTKSPSPVKWETYFEERLDMKMTSNLHQRRKLLYLWNEQNGICPFCEQKITQLTGWHNHHIAWRTKGGGNNAQNRVLLHPNCHNQVHSQGLTVAKPRPANGVWKAWSVWRETFTCSS